MLLKYLCCWEDEEDKESYLFDDDDEELLTDNKPLLTEEQEEKESEEPTKHSLIPNTSTLLHVNNNFNLTDKNFESVIIAFGFDDDGSIKPESKKEKDYEIEDLGPYNDYVSQEEVVEYKEVDIDFFIKVEAYSHWGCKLYEMVPNGEFEIQGVQYLKVNTSEKLKTERIFINLNSLDRHIAYLLFKMYVPDQSKQLETSYETKWVKGYLRKFVYKKIPRTNRFITRCIPKHDEECFRCITLVDPIHKPEDNLTGMIFFDSESEHWNFRSTFSFHVFPPTQLFVTIKKGKDLPVSTDEEPPNVFCSIHFLKQESSTKEKSDFTWNDECFLFDMKNYTPKEKLEVKVMESKKEVLGTIELDLLDAFELEKSKFIQDKSPKLVHEAWYKISAKQKKEDDIILDIGEILLELRLEWN